MLAKPPPMGVVTGPFRPTRVRSMDSLSSLGMYSWYFFKGFHAGRCEAFSIANFNAGGFEHADTWPGITSRANSVAGDEGYHGL